MAKEMQLHADGRIIRMTKVNGEDYVCLTDIARQKNADFPADVVRNWMRSKATVAFLGLWEQLHNPDFKLVEFDQFRDEAGSNAFVLPPQVWIEKTNAIGMFSKSGRYGGGTFAHHDIAFEFASWVSVEFKLYLITDYQRLKVEEQRQLGWSAKRELAKINYRIHTDAIQTNLIPAAVTRAHIRKRSRCAERGAVRQDAPAVAARKPHAERQSARLCRHQPAHLHLQHGEHQRRDDKRRHPPTAASEAAQRNRHPPDARTFRNGQPKIA